MHLGALEAFLSQLSNMAMVAEPPLITVNKTQTGLDSPEVCILKFYIQFSFVKSSFFSVYFKKSSTKWLKSEKNYKIKLFFQSMIFFAFPLLGRPVVYSRNNSKNPIFLIL